MRVVLVRHRSTLHFTASWTDECSSWLVCGAQPSWERSV